MVLFLLAAAAERRPALKKCPMPPKCDRRAAAADRQMCLFQSLQ